MFVIVNVRYKKFRLGRIFFVVLVEEIFLIVWDLIELDGWGYF